MDYGVSYYPEHKKREELEEDLKLLIDSGINTVRMGEFAWCVFEPQEGVYVFDWLDEVVERLGKAGIKTLICTPTATPPAWLVEKHPEIFYVDNRRITRPFGGRRHYCYNSPVYREYSKNIAKVIGQHYGENPYVLGFQIDNEPAQEGTGRCSCPVCSMKFRDYLKDKYEDIDTFNERSGGVFWSQNYTGFHQINPPVNTIEVGGVNQIRAFYENPTVRLEFERFSSQSQIDYQNIQLRQLKAYTNKPVTTNATGLATNSIDYYKSTKELDCYGFDFYPDLRDSRVDSFPYAFARGVKNKPFWVMEFMSGGGHRLSGSGRKQPNPGALEQATVQALAHGASMMLHFQFRTFPFGAEQLNYAIVDMDGVPRRRYEEMKRTAEVLNQLQVFEKADFDREVAILVDYDSHWALRIKPVNDPKFNYLSFAKDLHRDFLDLGICSDVLGFESDWSAYKMVVIPAGFLMSQRMKERIEAYVSSGGHLLASFLTSVKNSDNVGYTDSLPSGLTEVFGVSVWEVEPVFDSNHNEVKIEINEADNALTQDMYWSEILKGQAHGLGHYTRDYKKGEKVITMNPYGKGWAYYMGTGLGHEAMKSLLVDMSQKAGVNRFNPFEIASDMEVEVIHRSLGDRDLYYVFNFSSRDIELSCTRSHLVDGLSGEGIGDRLKLARNGYQILLSS